MRYALLIGGVLALISLNAHATPILLGTTTNPTGIDDLMVGSTAYNVSIGYTSDPASPFAVGSSEAQSAAGALGDAFNTLGVTGLDNVLISGNSNLIAFIDGQIGQLQDNTEAAGGPWFPSASTVAITSPSYGIVPYLSGTGTDVLASASFSKVPEPQTMSLLGAGLIGLLIVRTNKKREL